MKREEALKIAARRIREWPEDEARWWRALADTAPAEALLIARMAFALNVRPIDFELPEP